MTKSVKHHEDKYFHVPKFSLLGLIGIIVFGLLSYFNFLGIIELWSILDLGNFSIFYKEYSFVDLLVIPSLLLECCFVSALIVSIVYLVKGKIKRYDEKGLILGLIIELIGGLIFGFILGFILGLISGLITGLISGLISGLITGLIIGLISGLITGLIIGLIIGLITGLFDEFK